MKRASFDAEIRARVHVFVAGLTTLVKLATLQEAVEALEGGAVQTQPTGPVRADTPASVPSLDDFERAAIQRALVAADGNMVNAGKLLGMSKSGIYRRASALGVDPRRYLVRPTLGSNLPLDLVAYERAAFEGALDACGRDKAAAAKLLRMARSSLYRRTSALGITR